jgi:hypothetical protein
MPSVTTVTYGATVRAGAGAGAANPMAISAEGNQITVAATDRVTMHSLVVPDSTTDQAIDLGECASVSFCFIKSSAEITLQIDDGATGEVRGVNPVYLEAFPVNATALYLSNASGGAANVDVLLVGPVA